MFLIHKGQITKPKLELEARCCGGGGRRRIVEEEEEESNDRILFFPLLFSFVLKSRV